MIRRSFERQNLIFLVLNPMPPPERCSDTDGQLTFIGSKGLTPTGILVLHAIGHAWRMKGEAVPLLIQCLCMCMIACSKYPVCVGVLVGASVLLCWSLKRSACGCVYTSVLITQTECMWVRLHFCADQSNGVHVGASALLCWSIKWSACGCGCTFVLITQMECMWVWLCFCVSQSDGVHVGAAVLLCE